MNRRLALGMAVLALAVFIPYLANDILPNADLSRGRWTPVYQFPSLYPVGIDFRAGLYYPAKVLLEGKSPYVFYSSVYPPMAIVFGIPFRLLDPDQAYLVQVGVLYALNILSVWLAVKLAEACFRSDRAHSFGAPIGRIAYGAFAAVAFLDLTSYGFLFSIERGNFDIYAQAAALLGLWLMATQPSRLWLQVICLAIAAHLKVYPAILFVIVVWRHGWRSLLPLGVVNTALLLSTGPAYALQFFHVMVGYVQAPYIWVGNHSAASFASMVADYLHSHGWASPPTWMFYLLPAAVWGAGIGLLWRRKKDDSLAWMYILSVPMMDLIPSTSHDYKLVLLSAPAALIIFRLLVDFCVQGRWLQLIQLALIGAIIAIAATSYTQLPILLRNKYPIILALQVTSLWILLTSAISRPRSMVPAWVAPDRLSGASAVPVGNEQKATEGEGRAPRPVSTDEKPRETAGCELGIRGKDSALASLRSLEVKA